MASGQSQALPSTRAGQLLVNLPLSLTVGEAAPVEVRLRQGVTTDLRAGLRDRSTAEVTVLPLASRMAVGLTGAAFAIVPLTPAAQDVSTANVTTWRWQVTPDRAGRQTLTLTLAAADVPGAAGERRRLPVHEKPVTVVVRRSRRATRRRWLAVPTAIAAGGVLAWQWRRRWRR